MAPQNVIQQLLVHEGIWEESFLIIQNRNIRGQSISYFIDDANGHHKYIAKFFDYIKDISIPESIDIQSCACAEDLIEKLAEADDFIGDIEKTSDLLYYRKRSFLRYVQVCSNDDSGFPKVFVSIENIKIGAHFYGLLIEEAINGITLEEYIQHDPIPSRDSFAIDFLWNLSLTIEKFIKHRIVHRDISPDNIIFANEHFIIIDPGMVKIVDRNTTEFGYIMGKRHYASPEQYHGYALNATFTSDLYSIGLIAFEIVSGINPLKMYIDRLSLKPHEDLLNKYDRELEDIFFARIEDTERNQQLFILIRKMLQVDSLYRFDNIVSLQEAIRVLKEELND